MERNNEYRDKILAYVLRFCRKTGAAVAPTLTAALAGNMPDGPELVTRFQAMHLVAGFFDRPDLEREFVEVAEAIKQSLDDNDDAKTVFGRPAADAPFGRMYFGLLSYLRGRNLILITEQVHGQWWQWQSLIPTRNNDGDGGGGGSGGAAGGPAVTPDDDDSDLKP